MKNKEANRNVLKAISIGLSAALSLMPTVTAFADDDVDSESSSSESVEESSPSESNESDDNNDVKEAVDEASDAIDTASEAVSEAMPEAGDEGTQGYENLVDINSDLAISAEAIESLGADVVELDKINYEIEEANSDYQAASEAAESSVSYAETKTQEAVESVSEAVKTVDDSNDEAEKKGEEVSEAAEKVYEDAAASESAKEEASSKADDLQTAITEGQEAVDKAQDKLDEASRALTVAEGAVESAEQEKADADAREAEAKEKLEAILADSSVEYEKTEDGSIVIKDETNLDSRTGKAIEAAQSALDKAKAEADAAEQALSDAYNEEYNSMKEQAEAAQSLLDAAETTLKDSEAAAKPDENTEDWIAKIRAQQEVIKNAADKGGSIDRKRKEGSSFYESAKLATYIQAYRISQQEGVDPASISIVYDASLNDNTNLWYVRYKTDDSDCYSRMYVDVKCDTKNPGYVKVCEHPVTNPKPVSFGEDTVIGQIVSDNGKDQVSKTIQTAKDYLADKYGYDAGNITVPSWGEKGATAADGAGYIPVYYENNGVTERYYFYYGTTEDGSVEVYLKKPTEMGAAKSSDIYNTPGTQYTEAEFNAKAAAYENTKAEAETALEAARQQYNEALAANSEAGTKLAEYENNINELQAQSEKASELKDKVENARDKVVEAAEALQNAKAASAVSAEKLAELEEKLADAKSEYNKASEELESANEKLTEIKTIVDNMREDINNGFKYRTPVSHNTSGGGSETPSAGEETKEEAGSEETGVDNKEETGEETGEDKKEEAGEEAGENNKEETGEEAAEENKEETKDDAGEGAEGESSGAEDNKDGTGEDTRSGGSGEEKSAGGQKKRNSETRVSSESSVKSSSSEASYDSDSEADGGSSISGGDIYIHVDSPRTPDMTAFHSVEGVEDTGMNVTAGFTNLSEGIGAASGVNAMDSEGAAAASETAGGSDIIAGADFEEAILDAGVAGERMAPIVEAVENGTFTRSMMLSEEGTKAAPFGWWLIMLLLGAKGVQMYVKSRKKEEKVKVNEN